MITTTRFCILTLLLLILLPGQALAHKINVFAWVSGDTVTVESNFSANRPLINGTVTVSDKATNKVLLEGTGDRKGVFTFKIPALAKQQAMDLLIVVAGDEGHRNHWVVPATEYLLDHAPSTTTSQPTATPAAATSTNMDTAQLKQIVQEVMSQELAPIRRSLAMAAEKKPTFQDIMGGIGYILGLAGLVAWMKNRRQPPSSQK